MKVRQAQKAYLYVEAANGLMVRIPKDRYPEWKAAQDRQRAGEKPDVSQTAKELASIILDEK